MSFEERVKELGFTMPELPKPAFSYVPAVQVGKLVFASGQTPTVAGKLTIQGKLGREVSIEQGQEAARLAVLNCLAEVRGLMGSLDAIVRIVKLNGYVASAEGFTEQPRVINGASTLLEEIFGETGKHARAALGVAELPAGAPVEVEMVVEVR
ncbi:LysR family transcriptional regulator [Ktedonobacter sp. SOSP1-85]|uniref:RidA family protein n=1 Tax=Ktedonobacter sp. SOSP1-85 TaxID=2778367 RepID=UPI001915240D|nr:RidA family protein [Ktedonobacter sp. SOSP1-85]GHO73796.1 LysR family transcriptional regulator [Ktedonobacter sp. SOSP1-85]